jgi:hypothetical protein
VTVIERIARALYAYDNDGGLPFDDADTDTIAPYFDLAEIAVREVES